jgi:hypothetical protein
MPVTTNSFGKNLATGRKQEKRGNCYKKKAFHVLVFSNKYYKMVLYSAVLTLYFTNRLQEQAKKQEKLKAMLKKKACHTGYDRLSEG